MGYFEKKINEQTQENFDSTSSTGTALENIYNYKVLT